MQYFAKCPGFPQAKQFNSFGCASAPAHDGDFDGQAWDENPISWDIVWLCVLYPIDGNAHWGPK